MFSMLNFDEMLSEFSDWFQKMGIVWILADVLPNFCMFYMSSIVCQIVLSVINTF